MRLLGECPNCGAQDNIFPWESDEPVGDFKSVRCWTCDKIWKDWPSLVESNSDLIPFKINTLASDKGVCGAELSLPLGVQLPWIQEIRTVLKATLMVNFGLRSFHDEKSGLEGLEWNDDHESFRLIDTDGKLGLSLTGECSSRVQLDEVLLFYLEMIGYLLNTPLNDSNGHKFPIGQILRLSESQENLEIFLKILHLALVKARDSNFAQEVIKESGIG